MNEPAGIKKKNRSYIDLINRAFNGPFTINEAAEILHFKYKKTKRFLAYLASRGWLVRVKNGYYKTVPLGTISPFSLTEEPWVLASKVYAPCYIGGFSACNYWDLTEQIFKDNVVFTERKITGKILPGYVLRIISDKKMFGITTAWVNNIKVNVSDASRTIVDILNEPGIGGGIRNTADVIYAYFKSEHRNDGLLFEYLEKFGNRVLYKRLGYIIEIMKIDAPDIVSKCLEKVSSGYSFLDPGIKAGGKYLSRWNLIINAFIKKDEI